MWLDHANLNTKINKTSNEIQLTKLNLSMMTTENKSYLQCVVCVWGQSEVSLSLADHQIAQMSHCCRITDFYRENSCFGCACFTWFGILRYEPKISNIIHLFKFFQKVECKSANGRKCLACLDRQYHPPDVCFSSQFNCRWWDECFQKSTRGLVGGEVLHILLFTTLVH